MSFSQKLKDGKTFDTSIFRERLNGEQLEYCKRVFKFAKTLRLNSNLIHDNELFLFAKHFQRATELQITLNDDDTFIFPDGKFNFSKIYVRCLDRTLWCEPVEKILSNNLAVIQSFSLVGGYLNNNCILHLLPSEIKTIELENINMYTDKDRDSLIRYLLRLQGLEKLKAVYLKQRLQLNAFNDFIEHMQEQMKTPIHTLRHLVFTIRQEKISQTYDLSLFPNLNLLELHFTVERSFDTIRQVIYAINSARENKTCNPGEIIFKEYLAKPLITYSREEREILKQKSDAYHEKIIELNKKYVSIQSLIPYID